MQLEFVPARAIQRKKDGVFGHKPIKESWTAWDLFLIMRDDAKGDGITRFCQTPAIHNQSSSTLNSYDAVRQSTPMPLFFELQHNPVGPLSDFDLRGGRSWVKMTILLRWGAFFATGNTRQKYCENILHPPNSY